MACLESFSYSNLISLGSLSLSVCLGRPCAPISAVYKSNVYVYARRTLSLSSCWKKDACIRQINVFS